MVTSPAPSRRPRMGIAVVSGSAASTLTVSAVTAWNGNYIPTIITVGPPLLAFACVVCPAVWSRNAARRRAALDVLDRLLGRDATSAARGSREDGGPGSRTGR